MWAFVVSVRTSTVAEPATPALPPTLPPTTISLIVLFLRGADVQTAFGAGRADARAFGDARVDVCGRTSVAEETPTPAFEPTLTWPAYRPSSSVRVGREHLHVAARRSGSPTCRSRRRSRPPPRG